MAKYDESTLVIKHLPPELDVNDRVDLLKNLGAVEVSCVSSEFKKSSLTFAKFRTKEQCQLVLKHLHQKEILGSLLSVEYARGRYNDGRVASEESTTLLNGTNDETTSQRKIVEAYLKKLNSWTNDLDFNQPPPVHIRYQYPPPSTQVLRNICKALAKVPKLYTQVLHLMNKMNLPCPFSENFYLETDLVAEDFEEPEPVADSSTEESEIESDGDVLRTPRVTISSKKRSLVKKIKVHKFVKPKMTVGERQAVKPEEVFETRQVQVPKKIELKVSTDFNMLTDSHILPEVTETFGLLEPKIPEAVPEEEETNKKEDSAPGGVISAEELELNRIPPKDFHLLPVFKNYQPGPPTCRLYVKNLAKTVTVGDLEFIFNRYRVEETGDQVNLYDIRLMQEGRMKGQAFITLQRVELAEQAVKETNGYILKGKAIVVQFARSNKPK
uniref:RNA-binding region-containing protein 3 n=1 Tax=Lygus hesperus TaxID=30085 RepID=A0A146KST9_LYGHE